MALPKGNSIALQALKPLPELKVADLAYSIINTFEKATAAKESARLKALEDERKGIKEFTDKTQVKAFGTISNLTDQSSQLFRDTASYIGDLGIMAEKDPSKRYEYQALMQKASNNYNSLASTFGSPDFIKKAQEKAESMNNQDYFMDSDTKDRLEQINKGMLKMQMDKSTGEIKFALPRNANAKPDEPAKWYSAGEVQSWYTNPEELDWMNNTNANKGNTFPKELADTAKVFGDEWSKNTDGNRTVEWKGFASGRANTWFDGRFGKSYQSTNIDPRLQQYSKKTFGNEIDSEEDFLKVKKAVVDSIGAQVPVVNKTDTRKSALEMESIAWDIKNKKKAFYKQDAPAGGGQQPQFQIPSMQSTIVQVKDPNGNVVGTRDQDMRIVALPKLKGQPSTTNTFGVNRYLNKDGKTVTAYYLGTPAIDGKTVNSRVAENELNNYFVKLGYNPIQAKAYLLEETNDNKIPLVKATKTNKNSAYINTDVFLKTKYQSSEGGTD